jgi:hypothetical protein
MSQQTILEIAAPQCVAQDFEGEVIVLDLGSGSYYSLRELGAVLWRDLAAGHAVERLADLARGALGGRQRVLDFVADIMAHGLLRPAAAPTIPPPAPQLAVAMATGSELVFEVYDDMKNLILLDPVHEVDESRGWPNLPPNA